MRDRVALHTVCWDVRKKDGSRFFYTACKPIEIRPPTETKEFACILLSLSPLYMGSTKVAGAVALVVARVPVALHIGAGRTTEPGPVLLPRRVASHCRVHTRLQAVRQAGRDAMHN